MFVIHLKKSLRFGSRLCAKATGYSLTKMVQNEKLSPAWVIDYCENKNPVIHGLARESIDRLCQIVYTERMLNKKARFLS